MSLLKNKDAINTAYRRTVERCAKRVSVKDVREAAGKENDDGSPPRDVTFISLQLEEDAKTVDGDDMKAGAVVEISLNSTDNPGDDQKAKDMNRISAELFRSLVVAAMRLPKNCKDAMDQLEAAGGIDAIKGRVVVATFKPGKTGLNNVSSFAAVPEAAA